MKNKILLISIIPIILLIKWYNSPFYPNDGDKKNLLKEKRILASDDIPITLNGIDSGVAKSMQQQFYHFRKQDKRPIKENVWFDIATIRNMVKLLDDEIKQEGLKPCTKGVTDGIRIYFVSDKSKSKGHLKNSVILVSTKNFAGNSKVESGAIHQDYYMHSKNEPLFKENPDTLKGLTSTEQLLNLIDGNTLFDVLNLFYEIPKEKNDCSSNHFISRGRAHRMISQFGRDKVRTIAEWFDLSLFRAIANQSGADGLRIYFARHPKAYHRSPDIDYQKEAFILVPTTKKTCFGKVYHRDNYTCLPTDNVSCTPSLKLTDEDGGDDKGELCPENCDADSLSNIVLRKTFLSQPKLKKQLKKQSH